MRINKIEVRDSDSPWNENLAPGRYFLALVCDENRGCAEHYNLSTRPFRTNRSHEVKLQGWCGTTNNVSVTARGAVEVYQDKAERLRVRHFDAQALLDEVSPDNELAE
jgi:hypothetical protein